MSFKREPVRTMAREIRKHIQNGNVRIARKILTTPENNPVIITEDEYAHLESLHQRNLGLFEPAYAGVYIKSLILPANKADEIRLYLKDIQQTIKSERAIIGFHVFLEGVNKSGELVNILSGWVVIKAGKKLLYIPKDKITTMEIVDKQ